MEDIKSNVSKNLIELRTQAHLTQLQLAEMINYSDKAVSKWERGEAIPDLRVLVQLAEIYGITLDQLVRGENLTPGVDAIKKIKAKRLFISILSVGLVWFIATCLFTVLYFIPVTAEYAYLAFVAAPLPMSILLTVYSGVWGNNLTNGITSSLVLISTAAIFHVYTITFSDFTQIYYIYICAAVFEVLIILWFLYRWYITKKHI